MKSSNLVAMENKEPRPDIRAKVTGSAKYTTDVQFPDLIHAQYIRFPYGKGRITRARLDAARNMPGVVHVELNEQTEGQYAGQAIGEIAADSPQALFDALTALRLKCEPGQPVTRAPARDLRPPAPSPDDQSKLERLYQKAAAVVEAVYTTEVQTHSCLEPHAVTADVRSDRADVWVSTQSLMSCHEQTRRATKLPESDVTVRAEFVGGGFGSKFGIGAEGNLAIKLSQRYQRPCRVALDRRAEHEEGGNRPGSIQFYKIAVDESGRLLGGRMHLASTVGHHGRGGGVRAPSYYRWGDIVRTDESIPLNSGAPRAFRAPGYPQASFAMESVMDELAAAVRMDPVEFRILNETSDRRRKQLREGAKRIGWSERKPDGEGAGRVKMGFGCAVASWGNGQGRCAVDLDVFRSGQVNVRIGIQDIGTGANVLATDVAAWHLQLDRSWVRGKVGVSDYPPGPASGGSVTSRFTAPAVRDAAQKALDQLIELVAREWNVAGDEVTYAQGKFQASGREVAWKDACAWIGADKLSVRGEFNDRYWGKGNSDTAQFARVEVDTETGLIRVQKLVAIQACGLPINRLTAENQVQGGMMQGLSYALFENRLLDGPTGAQLNADLLQYKIAGMGDLPEMEVVLDVEEGEEGVRSLGEPVTIPTSGAIANAVANAIGVRVRSLPLTPARVLDAMAQAAGGMS
jgi:xanthine dehydrogenase YagR molybdenum-binding subunit